MNKTLEEKLKLLDLENFMYTFFIIGSLLDIDANEKVRNLYVNGKNPGEDIRREYLFASYLILTVFAIFMERNYYNLNNLSKDSEEYKFAELRLFGSILIVFGQMLIIYYLYNTDVFKDKY